MDTTKATKVVELTKGTKKVVVALWDNGQISSCAIEENKQECDFCKGNPELCQQYIERLQSDGYAVTDFEVGELGPEVSLSKFIEEQEGIVVQPSVVVEPEPTEPAEPTPEEPIERTPF